MFVLKCGNVELPAPVSMSVADEIIWTYSYRYYGR